MSEEEKDKLEDETEEETQTSNETSGGENPDNKSETEKTEEKSEEIQRRDAQNAHWREKVEKLEKELEKERGKSSSNTQNTQSQETQQKSGESLEEWKSRVEFRAKNPDYSDSEYDHVSHIAKEKGVSLEKAAESEKDYIQFQREKVAKQNNAPEPSSKQETPKKSPSEITGKELKDMSVEEKEEYFRSIGAGGSSMRKK